MNELIDLAGQIDITGDPRDIEELIEENKKQAAALDSIADETGEMELIEEMAVLKARLTTSSKKLRKQRDEMLDQGKSKPTFSREDPEVKSKSSSSHWYADQFPGMRWADEVEEEEKSHGRTYQPEERPRWNANLDQEEDESFIRGAHRDPSCKSWTSWPTRWTGLRDLPPLPGLSSRISIRTSPSGGRIFRRILKTIVVL